MAPQLTIPKLHAVPNLDTLEISVPLYRRSDDDFFSRYFNLTAGTETPAFFHRWAAITGLGAFLGRNICFNHGHFPLYPNTYCMLIGSPGTRKSSAIKMMKYLLRQANYQTIAADKTSKEKFLLDLSGAAEDGTLSAAQEIDLNQINIFGDSYDAEDKEMFIAADEFNDFIGLGNHDFISLLGNLWDYNGVYRSRIKNGKSVAVSNPTISILGGNTPTGFALAFPTEILGQGFFSRLLLVYGEPNGRRVTFPPAPCPAAISETVEYLKRIKKECNGVVEATPAAEKLLIKIYTNWEGIDDNRFASYGNRRFTHLLKLILVMVAARIGSKIEEKDIVYANTILAHTEHLMPKALGEFGKAKHSDIAHKVVQVLEASDTVMTIPQIWKHVIQDLEKLTDLADILKNLALAEKVQAVQTGFLAKRRVLKEVNNDIVDYSLLTDEELGKEI
jgi:hypothetical protein